MILVDTSLWIDFLKDREAKEALRLEQLLEAQTDIFTTGSIIQELLSGVKEKKTRIDLRKDMKRFLLVMPTLETQVQASEIFNRCFRKGYRIRSSIDCLIAAIALEYDIELLQKDRDFNFIAEIFPLKLSGVE